MEAIAQQPIVHVLLGFLAIILGFLAVKNAEAYVEMAHEMIGFRWEFWYFNDRLTVLMWRIGGVICMFIGLLMILQIIK